MNPFLIWVPVTLVASALYEGLATWAWYAIEERNPDLAASLESILEGFGWLFIIAFVDVSKWLAIPSILGTYLGVRIAVSRARRLNVQGTPKLGDVVSPGV